jgi:hypothetical protein
MLKRNLIVIAIISLALFFSANAFGQDYKRKAKRYKDKAKSAGKVTWKERAELQHKEKQASRKIYRMKKNKK